MNSLVRTLLTLAAVIALFGATTASAQMGYAAGHYAAPQAQAAYQQQAAAYAQNQAAWAAYYQQQANAQAWAAYNAQQAAARVAPRQPAPVPRAVAVVRSAPQAPASPAASVGNSAIRFDGRFASVGQTAPKALQFAVYAANTLQNKPYVLGAGHRNIEDSAYDCSSSTSYVLIKAGLLNRCLSSKEFANYGEAGHGRFMTIWVKPGEHVFMTICGLRMDTSGQITGEGPRWRTKSRSFAGFSPRHPVGM